MTTTSTYAPSMLVGDLTAGDVATFADGDTITVTTVDVKDSEYTLLGYDEDGVPSGDIFGTDTIVTVRRAGLTHRALDTITLNHVDTALTEYGFTSDEMPTLHEGHDRVFVEIPGYSTGPKDSESQHIASVLRWAGLTVADGFEFVLVVTK